MENIALIGSGGHAKVIVDLINELNTYKIIGFFDDDKAAQLYNIKYLGEIKNIDSSIENFIICIGNNKIRKNIFENNKNLNWVTLIHPSAIISESAIIGNGTVVCAGSILQTDVKIGKQCIINTASSIDHECFIDDFCSICPKATLCGQVKIGKISFIGSNSTIIQCIIIGDNCIIGAGTVVIKNIENNCKVVGNPGRII
tara:strand:+ start:141 stop:740 length:600 start_codon:yes stop_codon:yes gene_type:complete